MCGICGYLSVSTSPEKARSIVESMTVIQHHRGPDYTGYYFDDAVALGHNRLSLLDLNERSNQPFIRGQYVLVYNGEIYNYQDLRARLEKNHHIIFQTSSDTEVLHQALTHWGVPATLEYIKGMFAFGFYDSVKKVITIARDRLGIKPLFYSVSNEQLVFASEVKALCHGYGMQRLRPHLLLQAPFGIYENSRKYTAFEDIWQLEPGTFLEYEVESGQVRVTPYFRTADLVDADYWNELNKSGASDILQRFQSLFDKSVHSMILADAPMGAFVSGGIDSSLCAAAALQYRQINLYTSNVTGKFSEFPDAQLLAKHVGAQLNYDTFEPHLFLEDWVKATWHNESPIVVHTNAVPFQRVSRLAFENKDKAVLTGEGSDELFLGYPRLLTKRFDNLIQLPFHIIESIYKRIPGLTRYLNLNKTNYPADIEHQAVSYEKQLLEKTYRAAYGFIHEKASLNDQMRTPKMLDQGLHCLLWRNDRMGMMHSIESRFPFLDEEILRFAMNLPVKFKIGKTLRFHNWRHPFLMDKAVVRQLGAKYLPSRLVYKQKQGFPMYGHMFLNINARFFQGGFWQHFFGMSDEAVAYMGNHTDPYLLAKLASVEIWGSLFSSRQSIPEVESRVKAHIQMKIR